MFRGLVSLHLGEMSPVYRVFRPPGLTTPMKQNPARKFIRRSVFAASLLSLGILAVLLLSETSRAKDDWLPITPEDLALKDNPASPGAHAMILYRENFINADQSLETEYVRIKIFTEEGKKSGDVELPYNRTQSQIEDVRARTILPDGTVVNFEGKPFDKEMVRNGTKYLVKTFTFPGVTPGCIIEYKYRQQFNTDYYWSLEWTVQGDLYTRLARFAIKPSTRSNSPALYYRKFAVPGDPKVDRQKDGTLAMEVHDLPGLEQEDLMPPENALRARVSFFYRSQDEPQNETADQYWKRIGKKWNDNMERFIDKKSTLQGLVGQTVTANDSPDSKLQKLYERVQAVHNTSYDLEKTQAEEKRDKQKQINNVDDVLKRGNANGHELTYLMVGLARAAGFESSLVYVSPRSNSPFYPEMQDERQLSAELVWVRVNNKDVYLDPASQFYPYGVLPWYETGVNGLKLSKQGVESISILLSEAKDSVRERRADVHMEQDGTLTGTMEVSFLGVWGCNWREEQREGDEAGRKKALEDQIKAWLPPGATVDITAISNWDKTSEPLHVAMNVKVPGLATGAGHRALVPITFFQAPQPSYFTPEKRVNAIYFHYPYIEKDSLTLHFPGGYKIESVPAEAKANPGGGFVYDAAVSQDGSAVKVERQLVVSGILYQAKYYPALRKFFNTVKTDDDAQIVLHAEQSSENR
jgi:hypothetical protein